MEKVIIPSNSAESEFTEKKSRFISLALQVSGQEEIRALIKNTKISHSSSRHVVWAYILGDSRSVFGLSDDGEPHGTAGRPVLEVLKGSGMTDILVMVVRYFGGVKLGTGGLVSAYTKSAQDVLKKIAPMEKIVKSRFRLQCPYSYYDQLKKIVLSENGEILKEVFETEVRVDFELADARYEECSRRIRDMTSGSIVLPGNE